ncbi:MAG: hypothetical protein HY331_07365 [Chloroflexi bacterium]|nr:hypothetical protein [Chloroflexota bacterium]
MVRITEPVERKAEEQKAMAADCTCGCSCCTPAQPHTDRPASIAEPAGRDSPSS